MHALTLKAGTSAVGNVVGLVGGEVERHALGPAMGTGNNESSQGVCPIWCNSLGWRQPTRLCGAGLAAASTKRFNVFYLETKTVQGRPSKKLKRNHASRSRCAEEPEEAAAEAAWQ